MADESGRGVEPRWSPRDLTVSPGVQGYTVAIVNQQAGNAVVADGLEWRAAVLRAHAESRAIKSAVWVSRDARDFELLDTQATWLGEERVWRPFDRATLLTHVRRSAGVYVLRAALPVFVGDTANLQERMLYHLEHPSPCLLKHGALEFCIQEFVSADLRVYRAERLIAWWAPVCNDLK